MKYIIKRSEDNQFYNVLTGSNGKILSQTETMHRHHAVVRNIHSQMRGHESSKPIKVKDEVRGISYLLRLRKGKVEKFREKKLHRTK